MSDPEKVLPGHAIFRARIMLTNNEIKDIMKITKSLKNREIIFQRNYYKNY